MHLHLHLVQPSLEKLYTCPWDERVCEIFPGEVKTFFVRGLMFSNDKVFSPALAHGAVGPVGCCSPLGAALHSGIAGSFCFSAVPLHEVGFW